MRLAYLASSTIPSQTANSVHVMNMCEAFANLGHEIMLMTVSEKSSELSEVRDDYSFYGNKKNFEIRKFREFKTLGGSIRKLTLGRCFKKALKEFKPDLAYGRIYQGCVIAASLGIPTCFEMHGPLGRRRQRKASSKAFFNSPHLKQVVVISEALRTMVLAQDLAPRREQILVAHDSATPVADLQTVPAHWPGRINSLQAGYAGSLYPGRGVEQILEMAVHLQNVDFHLMGGTQEDINSWKHRGASANVFFHGYVPTSEIYKYRNACDVLLAPYQQKVSIHGGTGDTSAFMSPLKIFEYMASGKLMLVSDMPVLREVLDNSICMLLPPEDVSAWCQALEQAKDSDLRKRYADEALNTFLAHHTWEARAKAVLKAFP